MAGATDERRRITMAGRQITYEEIRELAEPIGNGWDRAFVRIEEGDAAPFPGSTKRSLRGAGTIVYYLPPEGGLELKDFGAGIWISWIEGVS
jgi:hypothetical protein